MRDGVDAVDSRSPAPGVPEINATLCRYEPLTQRVFNVDGPGTGILCKRISRTHGMHRATIREGDG
jgi:hypothetical protein